DRGVKRPTGGSRSAGRVGEAGRAPEDFYAAPAVFDLFEDVDPLSLVNRLNPPSLWVRRGTGLGFAIRGEPWGAHLIVSGASDLMGTLATWRCPVVFVSGGR